MSGKGLYQFQRGGREGPNPIGPQREISPSRLIRQIEPQTCRRLDLREVQVRQAAGREDCQGLFQSEAIDPLCRIAEPEDDEGARRHDRASYLNRLWFADPHALPVLVSGESPMLESRPNGVSRSTGERGRQGVCGIG